MKKGLCVMFLFVLTFGSTQQTLATNSASTGKTKICLALSSELGDESFNDMQYRGLIEVSTTFNVEIAYRVPVKDYTSEIEGMLTELADQEQCDLVIIGGFRAQEPLDLVAAKFPQVKFALLDNVAKPRTNVASVIFGQHEGSFVVGALAAYVSQTKKVGFVGGVDIPVVKSFLKGFEEGIEYVDPSMQVVVEYVSAFPDFSGFENPQRGYEIANQMYMDGVDIVYAVGGISGSGVIQAASEQQKYAIGVDSDQDHLAPGFVLTSMMKRLDRAVVNISQQFLDGAFQGDTVYEYGYQDGGVSITEMQFTKEKIPADVFEKIKAIEQKIVNGDIHVTNVLTETP